VKKPPSSTRRLAVTALACAEWFSKAEPLGGDRTIVAHADPGLPLSLFGVIDQLEKLLEPLPLTGYQAGHHAELHHSASPVIRSEHLMRDLQRKDALEVIDFRIDGMVHDRCSHK
jgi:hypothetical protein